MKRIIFAIVAVLMGVTACSIVEKREIITVAGLPVAAQQVLQENFPGQDASYVIKETEWLVKVNYDVRLESGAELDFDADGQWEKVDCKLLPVPEGILPVEIRTQVAQAFPGAFVTEIDKDFWGYDVELDNHLDIKFNRKFDMSLDD